MQDDANLREFLASTRPIATMPSTTQPSRHAPPSHQRILDTISSRPPHGNRHRHIVKLHLRSRVKTRQSFATNKQTTHRTSYTERTLATRLGPSITCGPCTIAFLGYPRCEILPPVAAIHRRREVASPCLANTTLVADVQWWTHVPDQSNGKPIHKPVETAYLHTDNFGYGWGAALNERLEAQGLPIFS
jgi:hypothetical protein